MSIYTCPHLGCDTVIGAVGPIDPDEPDYYAEDVAAHRRSHEPVDSASHRSSSQAGLATLSTSTGAVTDHAPAPVGAPTTHTLDRIPGEPNPLDVNPAVGFAKVWESELTGTEWFERPTVWITVEQHAALGSPQQITVTIGAVR